jgi:putative ABC transport system permease protein
MTALQRKLLRDTWHLRGPMIAVALVAASGVALFVTLRSMHGFLVDAQSRYYRDRRFAQVFAHLAQAPDGMTATIAALPGVAAVDTRVVADVLLDVPGLLEPATGRLVSVPAVHARMLDDPVVRSGRWLEPGRRDDVLASAAFCRANGLEPGGSFGAVIHGRWRTLRIVGTAISPEFIYEIRGAGEVFPDNRAFGVVWMERRALAAAFDMEGSFNDVALTLAPGAVEGDVIARLDRVLAPYGGLGAYGRDDHVSHRFVSDEIAETQVTSILIPSIFLGVTAFLLHLVLSRLVGMQREQIAVLKAFGYGNAAIAVHVLQLALLPVVAGSVAGTLVGLRLAHGLAGVYARFFQFPDARFVPDPMIVAAAISVGAAAATLGGLGAVRRAVALTPAEAMRPEAPARFAPGLIEKTGVRRLLTPAGGIVVRHLDRQPVKALLSVLGIALAFAIVMTGRYSYDAIDRIKEIQFRHVQREDLTVTFRDPEARGALHELGRMPGVERVEPFRAVAVRLRSAAQGSLVERTSVLGLEPCARLRRIVDEEFRAHATPRDGLLLTDRLAQLLRVRPGDTLVIEVLEGKRPVREVKVAGLVSELIGTAAYMDLKALDRLLREGDTYSGAFLAIDPGSRETLYARLKRIPGVTGVVVRASSLKSFENTIGESFLISTVTTVLFACVIAAGMIYNGARIALSERGRELASLRVLGFRRREIAAMVLGEQAFLTVLAIPVGAAIGYGLCALIVWRFQSELFRIPLVVSAATLAFAVAVVTLSAGLSALVVRGRIDRLDLVAVLKTRE